MLNVSMLAPNWQEFVQRALFAWSADMFSVRRALIGKSGATVMLVEVRTPQHDGLGILKLSENDSLGDESDRQNEARSRSPALAARIPQIVHSHCEKDRSAILMTVAGGGLLEAEVLATAGGGRLNLASQIISLALLRDWNPSPSFDGRAISVNSLLREWLEKRFGPDGRITEVLRNILHVSPECLAFRYEGQDYPNPYSAPNPILDSNQVSVSVGRGLLHCDLHSENVLISGSRQIDNYYFIDFAHCRNRVPIFFDHSYLELHLLLTRREAVTHQRWHRLCRSLAKIEDQQVAGGALDTDDQGLLWTIGIIRAEICKWIKKTYPQRKEDLKKQLLLSRVAAGLNFANKRSLADNSALSDKKKFFAFLYAATAAREFYEYCKLSIPDNGPVANPAGETPPPSGEEWREVWTACGGFDSQRAAYVLLVGSEAGNLPEHDRATLGRLPWSLVIDFNRAGLRGELLRGASAMLKRERGFSQIFPHQSVTVDFDTGVCWLFVDSDPPEADVEPLQLPKWRQQTLPRVRALAAALHRATAPRPVYLVVLGRSVDPTRLRNTFTALGEPMGGALETVVVSADEADDTYNVLAQENVTIRNVVCDWRDLALGLHQVLGEATDAPGIWIPVRDPATKAIRREQLNPEEVALYSGTADIVPASGSGYANKIVDGEVADFLHGNTISWRELDLHRDVDRAVVRGPTSVVQRLRMMLGESSNDSFAIEHSPGAGGTTVARRIVWELRDEFPCVVLKTFNENTVDLIEALFQRSNLPVLILAEASRLPENQRNQLFNEIKGRSVRFLILDVRRRHTPRNTASAAAVADPMSIEEAQRFLSQYEPSAPQDRRPSLRQLVSNPELAPYRSAFFFGLYSFERDFVRVEEFVHDLLSEMTTQARDILADLALITRYSQKRLPVAAFLMLLGLDVRRERFNAANLLGDAAAKLVMFDGKRIGISHPLLAQEIVRQQLSPPETGLEYAWRINLSEFCIRFIRKMAVEGLRESAEIDEILTDVFIERKLWQGSTYADQFSALLNELPMPESQRRVLETLCEHFPANAHFWNHLGRQINLCSTGSFEEAETKLKRAIEIEPGDEAHHHGLGMVYRFEVRRRLQNRLSRGEASRVRLDNVRPFFEKAEDCFATARAKNPNSQYPLVTPIQMALETFERFAALGGESNYPAFLCRADYVSEWCRAKISTAEILLAQLHHQEANSEPTRFRKECDGRLQEIIGNFEGMIAGLSSLLRTPGVVKAPVRRMLANAYVRRIDERASTIQRKTLRHIVKLMRENLDDDPTNSHDMRTWFRAFRMLSEFTLIEAIEQITGWSLVSDSIDALYYLYILHFISARRGIHKSINESKRYLEMCKRRAPAMLSKRSFEWWAADSLIRPCPLVHYTELGQWSKERDFFERVEVLGVVEGRIDDISSPKAGTIMISGMPAFFQPKSEFHRSGDLNAPVTCYLSFTYEGLHAWNIQRAVTKSGAVT